ncbi:MAG: ABC transporter permease, partial [Bacteroidales bacterium]|nr:ABC transporter permease [Bacteroidales bacterium]
MKIIIRNLISIIRRFKAAWLMNFAGISAAITALIFVTMQIAYENNFDKCQKDADRIFLVTQGVEKPFNLILDRGDIEEMANISPKIEAYSALFDLIQENYLTVERSDGSLQGFYQRVAGIDSGFVKIFDFDLICGNINSLNVAGNTFVSESTAMKFYGTTDIIGKRIKCSGYWCLDSQNTYITVTGVYKDFPENTQTQNFVYYVMNNDGKDHQHGRNWLCWLKLTSPNDRDEVESIINQNVKYDNAFWRPFKLEPLQDVYYNNENDAGFVKYGSR